MTAWRADNDDRVPCANWLAGYFGRDRGALVCSGSIALELALLHLGVKPGWRVVVSSHSCPQVPAAVLRSGATPVIVDTSQDLVLTARALADLDDPPQAVIAVHEWGMPCPLREVREMLGDDVPIIEDAAQAWGMHRESAQDVDVAEVVVTSLGPRKPLSIDGGGAAFANSSIDADIDTWSAGQRQRNRPAFPVALSKYALPHIVAAVERAEAQTFYLRGHVPELLERLTSLGLRPWPADARHPPGWHFIPVKAPNAAAFERLRFAPESIELGVAAPALLQNVPMLSGCIFRGSRPTPNLWLLLDPHAALENRMSFERWGKRARA